MKFWVQTLIVLLFHSTLASASEIAVYVGEIVNGYNTPFVSLTVCEPGTRHCKIIDRIKLDTGSTGLQIYKSALSGLDLKTERDSHKAEIGVCFPLQGGSGYWGPVARADVIFGDERAGGVPVHVVDPDFGDKARCKPSIHDGRNGILGISPSLHFQSAIFYTCTKDRCTPTPANVSPLKIKNMNPIAYLKTHHAGYSLTFPFADSIGTNSMAGTLHFGLDQVDEASAAALTSCRVGRDGYFRLLYGGVRYLSLVDSGTPAIALPDATSGITACGAGHSFLCPELPVILPITLQNIDGSDCSYLELAVTAPSNAWINGGLSARYGEGFSNSLILGLPFFFGRTIFFELEDQTSALGRGPLVAF